MIILNPLAKEHLGFLLEIRNHETTRNFLENDSIFNLEECEKWFEELPHQWYIIKNNDVPVGYFRTNGNEIGCDIHPKYRRRGYAKLAYQKFLKNKTYATLWVFEDNFAKNLYENLGFIENGEFKIIRDRQYIKMVYEK
jgi:RimJ/RimL family protein N-acetyltransferase